MISKYVYSYLDIEFKYDESKGLIIVDNTTLSIYLETVTVSLLKSQQSAIVCCSVRNFIGHITCQQCMKQWLTTRNFCPLSRVQLFD